MTEQAETMVVNDEPVIIDESGICPLCGSENVTVIGNTLTEDTLIYDMECLDCGSLYEEHYLITFDYSIASKD